METTKENNCFVVELYKQYNPQKRDFSGPLRAKVDNAYCFNEPAQMPTPEEIKNALPGSRLYFPTLAAARDYCKTINEPPGYMLVAVTDRKIMKVAGPYYYENPAELERFAEGLTIGAAAAGRPCGVIVHPENNRETCQTSKNMTGRRMEIYFAQYVWADK